jgi:flagellin-like hook-associated protein FlgL
MTAVFYDHHGEAMDSMNILMQRARELAVLAASDTQSASERKLLMSKYSRSSVN